MESIRAVLLDIDGTLFDSNEAHAQAWAKALAMRGHKFSVSTILPLIDMGGDKILPKVCGVDVDSDEGKRINELRAAIFKDQYLPHLRPKRGAEQLLELLDSRGYHLAVASSSKKDELRQLLTICGADKVIQSATSCDDAENSKPDPDILQAALGETGVAAEQTVLLGDTPYDMEAARKAGIRVIAFRCGGWGAEKLLADTVYNDPADLCQSFDDSFMAHQ